MKHLLTILFIFTSLFLKGQNPVEDQLAIANMQWAINSVSIYNLIGEEVFTAVDCKLWTVDFFLPDYFISK